MDAPSPHCIPSPPLFSLDVRNLGHLCFEELLPPSKDPSALLEESNASNGKYTAEKCEKFVPIDQDLSCESELNASDNCEDDFFDDMISELVGDNCEASTEIEDQFCAEDSLVDTNHHLPTFKKQLTSNSIHGHGAIKNELKIVPKGHSDNVLGHDTESSCTRPIQSIMNKLSREKIDCATGNRDKALAEAMAVSHKTHTAVSSQDTDIKKEVMLSESRKKNFESVREKNCHDHEHVGKKSVGTGNSFDSSKRSRSQPMTPAFLVDTGQLKNVASSTASGNANLKNKHAMASIPFRNTQSSTETSGNKPTPVASMDLPILPVSLESFRSQLSKMKPKKQSSTKKKTPKKPKDTEDVAAPAKTAVAKKIESRVQPAPEHSDPKETDQVKAASHQYDISEYFTSDEISSFLSVMCSDDEADNGDETQKFLDDQEPQPIKTLNNRGNASANQHVILSPHVDLTGASFSFGSRAKKRKIDESSSNDVSFASAAPPGMFSAGLLPSTERKLSNVHKSTCAGASSVGESLTHPMMEMNAGVDKVNGHKSSIEVSHNASTALQHKSTENSDGVHRLQLGYQNADFNSFQLFCGQAHVPSLLSALGPSSSSTGLQGLTGLSSVLDGASGIPSLSSMFAKSSLRGRGDYQGLFSLSSASMLGSQFSGEASQGNNNR